MGAEAVFDLLRTLDLHTEIEVLRKRFLQNGFRVEDQEVVQTAEADGSVRRIRQSPEWMIITVLPVLPPDLRPLGTTRRRSFCDIRS